MYTLNGIRQGAGRGAPVLNGGKYARINANFPYEYNKWRMVWNGNHFAPPEPSSVLWYPGVPGQGTTIQDFSGSANNGTITGAVWRQLPSGLWYLDYDGNDDYFNCGSNTSLDFGTGDFAITTWIKFDALTATSQDFFGKRQAATDVQILRINGTTNVLRFVALVNNVVVLDAITTPTYVIDTWYRITYTCDRDGSQKIYVNGVNQALGTDTQSSDGVTLTNTGELYWGVAGSLLTNDVNGQMALQRVEKRFVTESQDAVTYQQERHLIGV